MAPLLQFGLVNAVLGAFLGAAVAVFVARDRRPALAHLLWVLVLAKFVTPPLIQVGVEFSLPTGASALWRDASPWLVTIIAAIWGFGSAVWIARQSWLAWRFHRLLNSADPAPREIQRQAARVAARLGLKHCPTVVLVPELISPLLCGMGRPIRLVFPRGLLERLAVESRATLLAHELAHYGRGDHWVRILELVVFGLYWWHPVVWWVKRRIEAAEEECCDAWVVSHCAATPRVYAEALLETIDFLSESFAPLPPAATGLGQVPQLRQRLTQIMRGAAPSGLSGSGRIAVLLLATSLLPVYPVLSRSESQRLVARNARAGGTATPRGPTSRLGTRRRLRGQAKPDTVVNSNRPA